MTASTEILSGRRVYLDASLIIYLLDGTTRWAAPSTAILKAARAGQFAAVTGEAVVAEVMIGPYRSRDPMLIRSARELFTLPRLVEVVGHPAKVWDDAAMLRGTLDVPLIDGLHVATAAAAGCDALVTNDRRTRPALGVDVIPLANLATDPS